MSDAAAPAVERAAGALAAGSLRLLTPLGRGARAAASSRCGRWRVWLNWQEFTQLAAVAFGLLVARPGLAAAARRSGRAADAAAPTGWCEGGRATASTSQVQAGAAPMLFPKLTVPVGRRTVRCGCRSSRRSRATTERGLRLPDLPRGVHAVGPVTYEKTDPVGAGHAGASAAASASSCSSPRG